jgi:hypothetical protein
MKKTVKPIPRSVKTDKAVDEVYKLVISGKTDHELLTAIEENFPEFESSELISKVVGLLNKPICPRLATSWAWHATRLVYQKMLDKNDLAGALRAAKQIADLVPKIIEIDEFEECPGGSAEDSEMNQTGQIAKSENGATT